MVLVADSRPTVGWAWRLGNRPAGRTAWADSSARRSSPINSINVEGREQFRPRRSRGLPLASTRNAVGESPRRPLDFVLVDAAHAGVPLMKAQLERADPVKADHVRRRSASASITGSQVVMMPASVVREPSAGAQRKAVIDHLRPPTGMGPGETSACCSRTMVGSFRSNRFAITYRACTWSMCQHAGDGHVAEVMRPP